MDTKLTIERKDAVRNNLQVYIASYGSQNKAANSLDVAAAIVETSVTRDLSFCINENRANGDFIWAISPAGSGKTVVSKIARQQSNTFYILCDEDMKKKEFALEFARSAGLRVDTSKNARSIILEVVAHLRERKGVLIIFDEADKVSDTIFNYFITIFNYFEDMSGNQSVGTQFISTDAIVTRMERGLRYKKRGYQEMWSRLGSKFYEVDKNTPNDVEAICRVKGVTGQRDINDIIKEADKTNYDLRRVDRKIKAILSKNKHKEA